MNPNDDRQRHYDIAWRELIGLRPLEHPTFAGVSRVWRVVLHPTFHDDLAITVTDVDAGGWIELRVLPSSARAWPMAAVGYSVAVPHGSPPPPRVWETTLSAADIDALTSAMPPLPLPLAPASGIDGIHCDHEALSDGVIHRSWSWTPTPQRAPAHYAYVRALCMMAAKHFDDPAARKAMDESGQYFR